MTVDQPDRPQPARGDDPEPIGDILRRLARQHGWPLPPTRSDTGPGRESPNTPIVRRSQS